MGYVLVRAMPQSRWLYFGPWELALGPRCRFERLEDRGAGEFLKGKLLLDLRTAAATTTELRISELLEVVRHSRRALDQFEAVPIRSRPDVPAIRLRS